MLARGENAEVAEKKLLTAEVTEGSLRTRREARTVEIVVAARSGVD